MQQTAGGGDGCGLLRNHVQRNTPLSEGEPMAAADLEVLEVLTIAELARLAKQHRSTIYRRIADGHIRVVYLGRSTRIPRHEAERYLTGQTTKP